MNYLITLYFRGVDFIVYLNSFFLKKNQSFVFAFISKNQAYFFSFSYNDLHMHF